MPGFDPSTIKKRKMKNIQFISGLILFILASLANASLINNGTFDSDFDGWRTPGQVGWKAVGNGHTVLSKKGQANTNGKIVQKFALDENWTGLNISFDYKFKDWSPNGKDMFKAMLKIRTVDEGVLVFNPLEIVSDKGNQWKHINEYIDLTGINPDYSRANEALIIFKLKDKNQHSDAYARIDNVLITAVPEPELLSLLGLGLAGIAFAKKRKNKQLPKFTQG